jgi:hypothetical protein
MSNENPRSLIDRKKKKEKIVTAASQYRGLIFPFALCG